MPEVAWHTDHEQYPSVLESNRYMLDNEVACDVTFAVSYPGVDTELVRAHRYMLIARNPVFKAMLCGSLAERGDQIHIHDVHPTALREIIRYLYCEAVDITEDDVFEILYASKKYLITPVTKKCFSFLDTCITSDTVCPILNCALFYGEQALVRKCLRRVTLNTKEVIDSETFPELSQEAMRLVVESRILSVSEDELLSACVTWCRAQSERVDELYTPQSLKLYLGDAFYHLRIRNLSENLVRSCILGCGVLSHEEEECIKVFFSRDQESSDEDEVMEQMALDRFTSEDRCRVEAGEICCDLVTKPSGSIVIFNSPKMHTFTISEDILLHGVDVMDTSQSCLTGVHVAIIQDSKTVFQTGIKISAARRDAAYGTSIPLNLPKRVLLHSGEFSVSLQFKSLYGRNTIIGCCLPPRDGVESNGVLIKPVYSDSFHIGSLLFSVV